MRSNGFILLFGILFIFILDLGLYVWIKKFLKTRNSRLIYWLHTVIFVAGLFCYYFYVPRLKGPETYYWIGLGIGLLFLFYIPKLVFILINLICWPIGRFYPSFNKKGLWTASIVSVFCFFIILHGIT